MAGAMAGAMAFIIVCRLCVVACAVFFTERAGGGGYRGADVCVVTHLFFNLKMTTMGSGFANRFEMGICLSRPTRPPGHRSWRSDGQTQFHDGWNDSFLWLRRMHARISNRAAALDEETPNNKNNDDNNNMIE